MLLPTYLQKTTAGDGGGDTCGRPLTRSTNKETPHAPDMNNLMYILLRCALSANTKKAECVILDGSEPK